METCRKLSHHTCTSSCNLISYNGRVSITTLHWNAAPIIYTQLTNSECKQQNSWQHSCLKTQGQAMQAVTVYFFCVAVTSFSFFTFSAVTLLVGRQEGQPACKKTLCWFVGDDGHYHIVYCGSQKKTLKNSYPIQYLSQLLCIWWCCMMFLVYETYLIHSQKVVRDGLQCREEERSLGRGDSTLWGGKFL